jgi:hypothetical protein
MIRNLFQSDFDTLDIEDYLIGLTNIPRELVRPRTVTVVFSFQKHVKKIAVEIFVVHPQSRLCINCVTNGNYELPQHISTLVSDLYSAFQVLNLRNDALRFEPIGITRQCVSLFEEYLALFGCM